MPRKNTSVSTSVYPPLQLVVKQRAAAANAELKKLRRQVEAFHVYHLKDLMETGILSPSEFKEAVDPLLNASDDYYETFFAHVTVPNN